jgi:hypothetical protein
MQLGNDLLDLALRLVDRERKQLLPIVGREEPRQDGDAAHVQPAVGEHLQEDGVTPRRTGHADPSEGLALGEVQDPRSIDEHRWAGMPEIETPEVHLGDVGDER